MSLAIAAPELHSGAATVISGSIDKHFHEKFVKLRKEQHVLISSVGGDAYVGLRLAEIIKVKSLKVSVIGGCISVCAEIIMPAASRFRALSFIGEPIIAYHHNIAIVKDQFQELKRKDFDTCFGKLYRDFRRLRKDTGTSFDIWKSQKLFLGIQSDRAQKSVPCNDFKLNFQHKEWLPTSKQLREMFRLRFTGGVCADQETCFTRVLLQVGKLGDSYIVGTQCLSVIETEGQKALQACKGVIK